MPNRQQSGYEYNSSRNTRVFVKEMIVKDNLFLGDNCNLVYGLNSQISFSRSRNTNDACGNPTNFVTTTTMEDYIAQQFEYQLGLFTLQLPKTYRLISENVVMSEGKSIKWTLNNDLIDTLFVDSNTKSLIFQFPKPLYVRNADKIYMGVGELAGEIPNQFEINSEEVKIEKLAITDRIKLSQIMANDSDGILLENFAFQGNTIYSLTPSTTEGEVDKVYPYNPYRLIKRFMYSLITTDSSQMQHDGIKRYYLDLDGGVSDGTGMLTNLRNKIASTEAVFVSLTINLTVATIEDVEDIFQVTVKNNRRDLPDSWDVDTSANRLELLKKPILQGGFDISSSEIEKNSSIVNEICGLERSQFDITKGHQLWLREHGIGDVVIKRGTKFINGDTTQFSLTTTYPLANIIHYDSPYFLVEVETVNDNSFLIQGHETDMLVNNINKTITITVTVVNDNGNKFVFNGDNSTTPTFVVGFTYIFDQSDSSNTNHPLSFSLSNSTLSPYNLVSAGSPGSEGSTVTFTPTIETTVYLYCLFHGIGMGTYYNNNLNGINLVVDNDIAIQEDRNNRSLATGDNNQNIQVDIRVGLNNTHRDGSVVSYHNLANSSDPFVKLESPY